MAKCEVCGKSIITSPSRSSRLGSGTSSTVFEVPPSTSWLRSVHCGCKVIGHGIEANNTYFCRAAAGTQYTSPRAYVLPHLRGLPERRLTRMRGSGGSVPKADGKLPALDAIRSARADAVGSPRRDGFERRYPGRQSAWRNLRANKPRIRDSSTTTVTRMPAGYRVHRKAFVRRPPRRDGTSDMGRQDIRASLKEEDDDENLVSTVPSSSCLAAVSLLLFRRQEPRRRPVRHPHVPLPGALLVPAGRVVGREVLVRYRRGAIANGNRRWRCATTPSPGPSWTWPTTAAASSNSAGHELRSRVDPRRHVDDRQPDRDDLGRGIPRRRDGPGRRPRHAAGDHRVGQAGRLARLRRPGARPSTCATSTTGASRSMPLT